MKDRQPINPGANNIPVGTEAQEIHRLATGPLTEQDIATVSGICTLIYPASRVTTTAAGQAHVGWPQETGNTGNRMLVKMLSKILSDKGMPVRRLKGDGGLLVGFVPVDGAKGHGNRKEPVHVFRGDTGEHVATCTTIVEAAQLTGVNPSIVRQFAMGSREPGKMLRRAHGKDGTPYVFVRSDEPLADFAGAVGQVARMVDYVLTRPFATMLSDALAGKMQPANVPTANRDAETLVD